MSKPIDKLEFWAERIKTAVQEHFSVYVIHDAGWSVINKAHKELLKTHIPKDSQVLDAGCGYGRWSSEFENYTGVDFSPEFIKRAQGKYPKKTFIQGNLKSLPFGKKQFDWAFCVSIKKMVIDNLGEEEWKKMQKELKRVAKKVLILEYENPTEYEII